MRPTTIAAGRPRAGRREGSPRGGENHALHHSSSVHSLAAVNDLLRRVRWANLASVVVAGFAVLTLALGWARGARPEPDARAATVGAVAAAPSRAPAAGTLPTTAPP